MNRIDKKVVGNLFLNILGSTMLAFGVYAFIMPFDLIVGGATGISLIAHKLTGINVSTIALVINIAVLIPGYFLGGKKLVLGSVFSSLVYPLALAVFERIPSLSGIADSAMLATICGGVVCGAGIGLVMKSGGSTGGLDIPVLIIHKYFHLPVNTLMNVTDTCIMLFQIPFSVISNVLYGIVYTFIMTNTLNRVLTWGSERIKFTIVSEQYDAIRETLVSHDFGVTVIYARGGYTGTPIEKLESVMLAENSRKARRLIEQVDPEAFITIENVKDVRGRGYTMERIWINMDE